MHQACRNYHHHRGRPPVPQRRLRHRPAARLYPPVSLLRRRRRRRAVTLTRQIPRRRRRDVYGSKGIWMSMITPPAQTPASPCPRTRGIPRPRPRRRPPRYLEQMSLDREVYSRRKSPARRLGESQDHQDHESTGTTRTPKAAVRRAALLAVPTRRPRTRFRQEERTVELEFLTCRTTPSPVHGNAGRRLLVRQTKLKRTARSVSCLDTAVILRYFSRIRSGSRSHFIVRRTNYHNFEPRVDREECAKH